MGPVAIPALGRALSETEPELSWRAAKLLIGLGPPGRDEVLRALGFESDPRRQRALLDSLHPWQSPTLVPVLIRILATADRTSLDAARPAQLELTRICRQRRRLQRCCRLHGR